MLHPAGYYVARAWAYQADVQEGVVPACQWVRLACARNAKDLKRKKAPWRFDVERAERVCRSIEQFPHIKGAKARLERWWDGAKWGWRWQTVELEPWQCWLVCVFFGWIKPDGTRRYRTGLVLVPRKNAKSTLTQGIGLYLLTADGESGADIFSAATTRDQARIVYAGAQAMARRSPQWRDYFGVVVLEREIKVEATGSQFSALSADAGTLDGLNPHGALVDELHAHRTRAVWDVLETALGSRAQPVLWAISTAGTNLGGICHELWSYAQKVLEGVVDDDQFFAVNWTIDDEDRDRWDQEDVWRKANPNYGVSVSPDYLRGKALKARHSPAAINNFLTKHLNVWVRAVAPWMSMEYWEACRGTVEWDDLAACPRVVIAVDLAEKRDIASIMAVGQRDDGRVLAKGKHFLPAATVEASPIAQMSGWVRAGHLQEIEGDVQDFARLEDEIAELYERTGAIRVCFDRALAAHLMQRLQARLGEDVIVEVKQNTATFNPAMKELDRLVTGGTFVHDGDPVLAWMLSNVGERKTHMEESYPIKAAGKDSPEKIDGAIALLMGVSELMRRELVEESAYADHGLEVL